MNETEPSGPAKRTKAAVDFVKASEKVLSRQGFMESTLVYSGSINPSFSSKAELWRNAGAIPVQASAPMYRTGALLDLSPIAESIATTSAEVAKFNDVEKKAMEVVRREDLYDRVAEYQDSLMRLASSSKILQETVSSVSEDNATWVESVKANMEWIKKSVTRSVARVYQAFGKLFDKATGKIDEILGILSRWSISLKTQFIEKIRELTEHFLELLNNLISGLFGWIGKLKQIAQEKGFTLKKVTVTIDPIGFNNVTVFGFSIPIPEVKLPKIEMEFE